MAVTGQKYRQISGIVQDRETFAGLVDALHQRGYGENDISVLMAEEARQRMFTAKENTKAPEGASIGGVTGGIAGAIIGGLTLVGSVFTSGAAMLVAGPIVGALTGGAIGVASGGLIGALIGLGMPEHEARFFEKALEKGDQILVVAHVREEEAREIKALFERFQVGNLKVYR